MSQSVFDNSLISEVKAIIVKAQENAVRSINGERTRMYWHIGKRIFEEEQKGKERADYGTYLIRYLSAQLQPEFGSGFGSR